MDVTLIDRNDAFVFGFSKLDLMFGRRLAGDVVFEVDGYKKVRTMTI